MTSTLPVHGWRLAGLMVLAGAFAALSLPPVCALFTLPLGLLVLYRAAEDAASWKGAALSGFLFGMGFHTAGLYWLTNAILTRVHEFWWVVPFASPGVSLIIAPLIAIPAVLCRLVPAGWRRVLMFGGSWTAVDMGRVLIFSGFPWNPLGSDLEFSGRFGDALIQPASVLGVDGLTLALVLASLAIFRGRRAALLVLAGAVLWIGGGFWRLSVLQPLPVINPRAVLVQGNVPEAEIIDHKQSVENFRRYVRMTAQGVQQARLMGDDRPSVVIWPESGFPGLLDEDDLARQIIAHAAGGAPAMIGSDREENGHWYNSLEVVDQDGKIAAIYDKSRLVPFGEYQPWILPFNVLPGVLTPGPGLKTWSMPDIGKVGPMVCYEIIFSGSVVAPHDRPDWLVTISNDAWYGDSAGPRQHLATGRMRAVEEGLPVVFANNTGISAVYDAAGRETARLGWGKTDVLVSNIPSPLPPTLFSRYGRAIPLGLSIVCVLLAFWPRRRGLRASVAMR